MNLDQYEHTTAWMAGIGNVRLYTTFDSEVYPPNKCIPVSDYGPSRCPYCGCSESFNTRLSLSLATTGCGGWWWRIYECHVVAATARYPTTTATYILGISERTPECMTVSSSNADCDII